MVDTPPVVADDEELPDAIGAARMLPDGTLDLMLMFRGHGVVGDGVAQIQVGGKDPWGNPYQMWLDHLSPIRPGDDKLIPPFPPTQKP